MIQSLHIKNFAIVEDLAVEFYSGLNILTGATGAGKSIIVGAMNLILGERASSEMVRSGEECAEIESGFEIKPKDTLKVILGEMGIVISENALLIRREISSKGTSRCFINDKQVTLASLKLIGDKLADLHGQHEHQSLLNPEKHMDYLDSFAGLEKELFQTAKLYLSLKEKIQELKSLEESGKLNEKNKELYSFQLKEIREANLEMGEEEKLAEEKRILENSEKLSLLASSVFQVLYESEDAVVEKINSAMKEMEKGAEIDSRLKGKLENLNSAFVNINEVAEFLRDYQSSLEFNPQKLEQLRERLEQIHRLKKKYGNDISEVLKYAQNIEEKLQKWENREEEISQLKEEIVEGKKFLLSGCLELSQKRKEAARKLAQLVKKELVSLGMEKTKFEARIFWEEKEDGLLEISERTYSVDERGLDKVEFFVSPNPGEELKPLAKIASGGEISRLMLALKSILTQKDSISTLIFDEIDSGIGGEIAQAVGKKLKQLSSSHQIICITHLQQIASFGEHHFKVYKELSGKRTTTRIKKLNKEERIKEIARMISGEKISELTLEHAAEIIREGNE
jgi:DNA repair protein RecN (Recombination protein N)